MRSLKLRAQAYLELKRYNDAIPVLQKAEAQDPHDPQLPAALGHAYIEKKDYPDAIRTLVVALQMDSQVQ